MARVDVESEAPDAEAPGGSSPGIELNAWGPTQLLQAFRGLLRQASEARDTPGSSPILAAAGAEDLANLLGDLFRAAGRTEALLALQHVRVQALDQGARR
jgi:hypothetical protein